MLELPERKETIAQQSSSSAQKQPHGRHAGGMAERLLRKPAGLRSSAKSALTDRTDVTGFTPVTAFSATW